jgi:hypothetical protein
MKYSVTKLTSKSNFNINYIFEHYPKLLEHKIKDPYFIKLLYTLIYKALQTKNEYTFTTKQNVSIMPSKNEYFPDDIRAHIIDQTYTLYTILFKIKEITINVKIYENTNKTNKININKYIYFIKLILNICATESTTTKKHFDITFYLTPFEKTQPSTSVNPEHINSGYCMFNGELVIFRKEEWFKVFIHECFHLFCLDFNEVNIDFKKIFSIFFIKSDFLFFESLVEFWARTINIAIVSYFTKKNISYEDFEMLMEVNLSIEKVYCILQMKHFLSGMNITYQDMITKSVDYNETTNGFCYYVLPALLISHYEQTMLWFVEHNQTLLQFKKNTESVYLFYQYIRSIYKSSQFLQLLEKDNYDLNNMNMCAFDIDF